MNDLRVTFYHMYRLAHQYVSDVPLFNDVSTCFDYVRAIPYVADRDACGVDECLKRPIITIRFGGDCDDKAILAGACMERMGLPWRIVCVNYDGSQEFTHTYIEIFFRNAWLPFDPTYTTNLLFVQKRKPIKIMRFDNPGQNVIYTMGYKSLGAEPGQSGDSGNSITPNQQNMSAWKEALSTTLKIDFEDPRTYSTTALTLTSSIGTALGATWAGPLAVFAAIYLILKNVGGRDLWSPTEGWEIGQKFFRPVHSLLTSSQLPEDGKKELVNYAQNFNKFMLQRFGDIQLSNVRYSPFFVNSTAVDNYSFNKGASEARKLIKMVDSISRTLYKGKSDHLTKWNDSFEKWLKDKDYDAGAFLNINLPIVMLSQILETTSFEDQLRSVVIPAYDEFIVKPFVTLCQDRFNLVVKFFGFRTEVPDKTFGKYHAADFVVTPKSKLAEIRLRVVSSPGYAVNQDMVDYVAALDYAVVNYERMKPRPTLDRASDFDSNIRNDYAGSSSSGTSLVVAAGVALLALSQG